MLHVMFFWLVPLLLLQRFDVAFAEQNCDTKELRICLKKVTQAYQLCDHNDVNCQCAAVMDTKNECGSTCDDENWVFFQNFAQQNCDTIEYLQTQADDNDDTGTRARIAAFESVRFTGDSDFQHRDDLFPFPYPSADFDFEDGYEDHGDGFMRNRDSLGLEDFVSDPSRGPEDLMKPNTPVGYDRPVVRDRDTQGLQAPASGPRPRSRPSSRTGTRSRARADAHPRYPEYPSPRDGLHDMVRDRIPAQIPPGYDIEVGVPDGIRERLGNNDDDDGYGSSKDGPSGGILDRFPSPLPHDEEDDGEMYDRFRSGPSDAWERKWERKKQWKEELGDGTIWDKDEFSDGGVWDKWKDSHPEVPIGPPGWDDDRPWGKWKDEHPRHPEGPPRWKGDESSLWDRFKSPFDDDEESDLLPEPHEPGPVRPLPPPHRRVDHNPEYQPLPAQPPRGPPRRPRPIPPYAPDENSMPPYRRRPPGAPEDYYEDEEGWFLPPEHSLDDEEGDDGADEPFDWMPDFGDGRTNEEFGGKAPFPPFNRDRMNENEREYSDDMLGGPISSRPDFDDWFDEYNDDSSMLDRTRQRLGPPMNNDDEEDDEDDEDEEKTWRQRFKERLGMDIRAAKNDSLVAESPFEDMGDPNTVENFGDQNLASTVGNDKVALEAPVQAASVTEKDRPLSDRAEDNGNGNGTVEKANGAQLSPHEQQEREEEQERRKNAEMKSKLQEIRRTQSQSKEVSPSNKAHMNSKNAHGIDQTGEENAEVRRKSAGSLSSKSDEQKSVSKSDASGRSEWVPYTVLIPVGLLLNYFRPVTASWIIYTLAVAFAVKYATTNDIAQVP